MINAVLGLALYALAVFGVSWTISLAKISFPLRAWLEKKKSNRAQWLLSFMECAACTGFWIGVSSALWLPGVARYVELLELPRLCGAIAFGFATLSSNLIFMHVLENER